MAEIDTSVWYKADIGPRLSQPMRDIFCQWSGVSEGELDAHLHTVVCLPGQSQDGQHYTAPINNHSETKRGNTANTPA